MPVPTYSRAREGPLMLPRHSRQLPENHQACGSTLGRQKCPPKEEEEEGERERERERKRERDGVGSR